MEIMVDLGNLVPRKFLSSQKIFREITVILSQKLDSGKTYRYFVAKNEMLVKIIDILKAEMECC